VLWGDRLNKKFYVYGGALTEGVPLDYHLYYYDILDGSWHDLGPPQPSVPPNISAYGAGVGISQAGEGYYYGGWISNTSMRGWNQPQAMNSALYRYQYDSAKFTRVSSPKDNLPRAEGAMTWIPAGDTGLLIYFGGVVDPFGNGTIAPQPMDKILVYYPSQNMWFTQTATGEVPQNRRLFSADAAWAPDRSSYNMYVSLCTML
jgi:hypothetical protein